MGRLREPTGSEEQEILREHWRNASATYYKKNREKILENLRLKIDVRCVDCQAMVFDPSGNFLYVCPPNVRTDMGPYELRICRKFKHRNKLLEDNIAPEPLMRLEERK